MFKEALTHRSYINENPRSAIRHNERLEYLGDAVLELIITEYLFATYPTYEEGPMTSLRAALVNYQMLAKIARGIDLEDFILLSRGEKKDTGKAREVILANTLEALIGAIYFDQEYDAAKKFVLNFFIPHLAEVLEKGLYRDPKSLLQEIIQEKMKLTPNYKVLEESGPDHNKEFVVGVFFGEKEAAEGSGSSKQEAESRAAEKALKKLSE